MDYWKGAMDWPVDKDWRCETCGEKAWNLIWGLAFGTCRCEICHTQYTMWDGEIEKPRTIPKSRLKPEYVEPAKKAWAELGKYLDRMTEKEWERFFEEEE